ncbi:MAG: DUF58 domain-containing protein [Verrucomicrobiae bacterium]|nr:DUF58 domain-containing protein [Verrucomicrobiae bacterium]MCP5540439.1 DUF58 domain-containing protein [Akkermansiaceae bacterium]
MKAGGSKAGGAAGEKPAVRVAAPGLALLWIGIATAAAGVSRFDGMLLLLGGLFLALLGAARWWAPRNLAGLRATRRPPAEVFAGETFPIAVTLERDHWGPAFAVRFRDAYFSAAQPGTGQVWVDSLPARGSVTVSVPARLTRRGLERRGRVEWLSRFPLGLFETRLSGVFHESSAPATVLVLPRPLLPDNLRRELEMARFETGHHAGLEPEPFEDFRGIREYRPGDPLKAIHWAATARSRAPMVREWDPPGPRPRSFGLLLHDFEPPGAIIRPDRFEALLRLAAGIVLYCRDAEIPLRAMADFLPAASLTAPRPDGYREILRQLARCGRRGKCDLESLARAATKLGVCDRVFIAGEAPLSAWRDTFRKNGGAVCLDTSSAAPERIRLRVERPAHASPRPA